MEGEINGDRISTLPDSLIHHIFSFLDMIYVVRTSVLSKRWRSLWNSLRYLSFDNQIFDHFIEKRSVENGESVFMNFVDQVLDVRDNADIHTFRLHYYDDGLLPPNFNSWVSYVDQHNVQDLDLEIYSGEVVKWPDCLFTCKSLRKLKLNVQDEWRHQFQLPELISLLSLKILHLESLSFVNEKLTSRLFSSCPNLEALDIENCDPDALQELIISPPKLQCLRIKSCLDDELGFLYDEYIPDGCKIKISAPNLTSFVCKDFVFREHYLLDCPSLDKADLDIQFVEYYEYGHDAKISKEHLAIKKEDYDLRIRSCLAGVSHVKALILSASLLEFVSEPPSALGSIPTHFCHLRYLKLEICLSRHGIGTIMHLLKISPSIETLALDLTEICCTEHPTYPCWDEKNFGSENLVAYREAGLSLNHLKFVEIQNALGCINELKFVENLLEVAVFMEKIVISTSMRSSPDREKAIRFQEKLLSFPRASSCLLVILSNSL